MRFIPLIRFIRFWGPGVLDFGSQASRCMRSCGLFSLFGLGAVRFWIFGLQSFTVDTIHSVLGLSVLDFGSPVSQFIRFIPLVRFICFWDLCLPGFTVYGNRFS